MKYTLAIAALLGLNTVQGVALTHYNHEYRMNFLNMLLQQDSSSDDEDDEMHVQYDEFPASMDGSEAHGGYTRDMPARFAEERDDRLMNSLVSNYAREVKDSE